MTVTIYHLNLSYITFEEGYKKRNKDIQNKKFSYL